MFLMKSEVPLILAAELLAIRRDKCLISLSKHKFIVFKKEKTRIWKVRILKYYLTLFL